MRGRHRLKPTIFLMKNRKGQFYLIAAIIIIAVLVGFITISNYSRRRDSVQLYDLGEELGIESQNVLDYGTYNSLEEDAMDTLLRGFIENYVDYAGEGKNLYFIFGDPDGAEGLKVVAYENLALVGESPPITTDSGKVLITIDDFEYQFDLVEGHNFYFVISQEIAGEKYVVTG